MVVILFYPVIEYMRSWSGDIGRATLTLCRHIRSAQKVYAPRKTGLLQRSIEIGSRGRWVGGLETSVGANPQGGTGAIGVAMWQELGTRPHSIPKPPPMPPGRHMVFFWPKVGHVVWLKSVNHPGNPATHWATRGAATGMALWR